MKTFYINWANGEEITRLTTSDETYRVLKILCEENVFDDYKIEDGIKTERNFIFTEEGCVFLRKKIHTACRKINRPIL